MSFPGARSWAALAAGAASTVLVAVTALVAGLLLGLSPANYLAILLLFAIPLAAPVAVMAGWAGPSAGLWLTAAAWGASAPVAGPAEAVFVALPALAGLALASAVRGRWSFGWTLTAVAVVLIAAAFAHGAVHREDVGAFARGLFGSATVESETGAAAAEDADEKLQLKTLSQSLRQLQAYWFSIGFGLSAALLMMLAAVLTLLGAAWTRFVLNRPAYGRPFRELRPPDHLVWLAIACAALGFVDWRWGAPLARHIAWNGGIALSAVYFLNGLAVLVYVMGLMKSRALLPLALLLVFLAYAGFYPTLAFVGLFDTWGEFRAKFQRLADLARERAEKGPNDDEG